ncbi:MAG: hypothetical protein A2428_03175 [Bdellovibrionales bacterium RIFOXYC1_FULL_54_43]|nr:MAG: hypothetical protein A2428_03175 [Bdellovibrionales bacterium RIFOXYC1_FULL_54_43]OFZ82683.1 MAG: hypothetical protein A2603_02610 [Bdellovibrionales bacterium RIFOXYD1_FULL_55_31]
MFIMTSFLFSLIAFAVDVTDPLSTVDFFTQLIALLGGVKGATGLGIAIFAVQILMMFFRTEMANFAGKWKLTIVLGLSLMFGIMASINAGTTWFAAIFNSVTITAIQVFANQLYKQLTEKNETPPATPVSALR